MTLKGKRVEEPFIGLPEGDWMWSIVRENLNNLATASGKDTAHILKALHKQVLDKLDALRPTLKELGRVCKSSM